MIIIIYDDDDEVFFLGSTYTLGEETQQAIIDCRTTGAKLFLPWSGSIENNVEGELFLRRETMAIVFCDAAGDHALHCCVVHGHVFRSTFLFYPSI